MTPTRTSHDSGHEFQIAQGREEEPRNLPTWSAGVPKATVDRDVDDWVVQSPDGRVTACFGHAGGCTPNQIGDEKAPGPQQTRNRFDRSVLGGGVDHVDDGAGGFHPGRRRWSGQRADRRRCGKWS